MYIAGCIWVLMVIISSLALMFHKWNEAKGIILVSLIIYTVSSIFLLVFGIYGLEYK
ncbi:hypothetical protein ACEPPU_24180 [Priestia aryabhattai]|uniref:hypothetical protein n=1 Tax=Priestia aryabhattai TaxID=412384 RepID=UPI0035ABC151